MFSEHSVGLYTVEFDYLVITVRLGEGGGAVVISRAIGYDSWYPA